MRRVFVVEVVVQGGGAAVVDEGGWVAHLSAIPHPRPHCSWKMYKMGPGCVLGFFGRQNERLISHYDVVKLSFSATKRPGCGIRQQQ